MTVCEHQNLATVIASHGYFPGYINVEKRNKLAFSIDVLKKYRGYNAYSGMSLQSFIKTIVYSLPPYNVLTFSVLYNHFSRAFIEWRTIHYELETLKDLGLQYMFEKCKSCPYVTYIDIRKAKTEIFTYVLMVALD